MQQTFGLSGRRRQQILLFGFALRRLLNGELKMTDSRQLSSLDGGQTNVHVTVQEMKKIDGVWKVFQEYN